MAVVGCAFLLLIALQLAGPCGAAGTALPVVINTWAFRKATETGVPAGRGGAGQDSTGHRGRWWGEGRLRELVGAAGRLTSR